MNSTDFWDIVLLPFVIVLFPIVLVRLWRAEQVDAARLARRLSAFNEYPR